MSAHGIARPPEPYNEPIKSYAPGSARARGAARAAGRARRPSASSCRSSSAARTSQLVGDVRPGHAARQGSRPRRRCRRAARSTSQQAIDAAATAWHDWSRTPWEERAAVLLRAAELLAGPWRATLNAATMLGQSKTAHQAEIDAACELIDFWRFNVSYMTRIYEEQPVSSPGVWNRLEYRPLEGFVFAVTPFNFTAIGGNLPTSAALMGNTVVWKPASTAAYSAHFLMRLLQEAGLPDGVINLVYGSGAEIGDAALASRDLAGVHFTGSTGVFQSMWKTIGANIANYRNYPRIVGETGGKDFILAHESADVDGIATAIVRGAFEYQGQKCSAASRLFIADNIWPELRDRLAAEIDALPIGDVRDFRNFMGAVIDGKLVQDAGDRDRRGEGEGDDRRRRLVRRQRGLVRPPDRRRDRRPGLPPDEGGALRPGRDRVRLSARNRYDETLELVDNGSPYGLTGAVFARDRDAIDARKTGCATRPGTSTSTTSRPAPSSGSSRSAARARPGTNDKAGSMWNLIRWVSPRTVKETVRIPGPSSARHTGSTASIASDASQ